MTNTSNTQQGADYGAYVLTYKCPDQLGILARVANLLYARGAFITEVAQYSDPYTRTFFSRMVFDDRSLACAIDAFIAELNELAGTLNMEYRLRPLSQKQRVLLAVSKEDHCLNVLLTKWRSGALPADIVGVISNHNDCRGLVEWYGIPYHHLPVTADTKTQQEAQITALMQQEKVDLLVLARYMQILSDELCSTLQGRAINIHHSFLPSFKGARPYHQAHSRGVKVVGATAHYVTADLDEGPILVQEVKPVSHTYTIEQLVHLGHDIEATALSNAVRLHCEDRVMLNGDKTVILQ
ncbi:MAG: formyltetrahydrofolate deformylase [Spongiibacteraceae bacterium]|nr:formyltetrahydrofolate deformylase [Spongiibacteraceae bacterium]|tara:strand:+ start:74 stop:961 length:888 start_codon:yes stop_codon:yes gene_type:complete